MIGIESEGTDEVLLLTQNKHPLEILRVYSLGRNSKRTGVSEGTLKCR